MRLQELVEIVEQTTSPHVQGVRCSAGTLILLCALRFPRAPKYMLSPQLSLKPARRVTQGRRGEEGDSCRKWREAWEPTSPSWRLASPGSARRARSIQIQVPRALGTPAVPLQPSALA